LEAACIGQTEVFFTPYREAASARDRREFLARATCRRCPVVEPCRAFARKNREYGFWGGESEDERARAGFGPLAPIGRTARTMLRVRREEREA
jgi:WhiB family redox-sensing transcriptional regulator